MRCRVSLFLAFTLVLISLSGIAVSADKTEGTADFYCNELGGMLSDTNVNNMKRVNLYWSVSGATITVQQTRQWNPETLSYDKTISVSDVLCSPTISIQITNCSQNYYCQASAVITPADGFTLGFATPLTVSRTEKSNETDVNNTTGYPLSATISEDVTVQTAVNGVITIGPWLTANQRTYASEYPYGYAAAAEQGFSDLTFTFSATNDTLKQSLCNPASWTDTTFAGGNTINIANVTVTLAMVDPTGVGYTK